MKKALILLGIVLLISCDPIPLKDTIDEMVLGWTRAVTLTSPTDEAEIAEKTPLLDWEDAGGAEGYEVQIVKAEDQLAGSESIELTESQYEMQETMVLGALRYWRVRAVSSDGSTGDWSDVRSFKIVPSAGPELVNTLDLGVKAWALEVSGNTLLASAGEKDIKVFDISSPASPELIDTVSTRNGVWDIDVSGDYAYVSESFGSNPRYVYILDISDPANVVVNDLYGVDNQLYGLLYGGTSLFVGFFNGYYRFDNTLSMLNSTPALLDPSGSGNRVNSFDTYGSYLVYTIDDVGIRILQMNGNNEVGSAAATFQTDWDNSMVTVYGHYAYATSMNVNSIEIFDIEDVTNPVSTAAYPLSAGGNNISIADRFAFVSDYNGSVTILDLSVPESPVKWGDFSPEDVAVSIHAVSGNYLYGTNYSTGKLLVVDLLPGD